MQTITFTLLRLLWLVVRQKRAGSGFSLCFKKILETTISMVGISFPINKKYHSIYPHTYYE
ncbi:hypothetical protein AHAS_Ahas11G0229000 [Arachis hypogaea]